MAILQGIIHCCLFIFAATAVTKKGIKSDGSIMDCKTEVHDPDVVETVKDSQDECYTIDTAKLGRRRSPLFNVVANCTAFLFSFIMDKSKCQYNKQEFQKTWTYLQGIGKYEVSIAIHSKRNSPTKFWRKNQQTYTKTTDVNM